MTYRSAVLLVTGVAVVLMSGQSVAQTVAPDGGAVPRASDGHPDLQGVWSYQSLTPLQRPAELGDQEFLTTEEAAAFVAKTLETRNSDRRREGVADVRGAYNQFWFERGTGVVEDRRTSLIVDPVEGRLPPLQPDAITSVSVDRIDDVYPGDIRPVTLRSGGIGADGPEGPEDRALAERCLLGFNSGPPMLPSAYNNNVQIFQTGDHVVILHEMVHDVRIVRLDEAPRLPEDIRQWMGAPRGYWDGDTLVVESRNFTAKTASFNPDPGTSHGSGLTLHLEERFTRVDADTLRYEFTIDDPHTFTRQFTGVIPMRPLGAPLFEYACHEGNYGLLNMMRGARQQQLEATR